MAILRCFALLLVVAAAVHSAPRPGKNASPEVRACFDLLKPTGGREAMKTIVDTCIGEQDGLQAIIDGLKETAEGSESGGRPGGRGRGGRRGGGGRRGKRGGKGGNPIKLLEDAGNTAEAETLNKCIAKANGHLTDDGTESFDVETFKTEITTKAEGSDSQANIQLGIDQCPDDSLTSFDVHTYMKCVVAFCATGEAPSTDAPPADGAEAIEP